MRNHNLTRRDFLQAAGVSIATSVRRTSRASSSQKHLKKPNFLVIFTDDQTYRAIGYNNPQVKTPVLDSMAKEGIIFENAYVATPICVASRASILTSLFPQQHEAVALNAAAFKKNVITEKKYRTLAHDVTVGGYRTAFYGKSHLGNPTLYGFQQGHRMIRTKKFKYILSDTNDEALFDELKDPYEMKNLALRKEYQPKLSQMRQYLHDWMDSVNDTHARPPTQERLR